MASGKIIHNTCGPCSVDDVTKNAWRWCTSCEEGLCEDCEHVHRRSKSSRNHKVITIEDYRKIEQVSISQVCEHHGKHLEWFCKSHDEVLCIVCVPSKHKACSNVIPISESSASSRESAALFDLEEMIEGSLCNVKKCIKNRESATKELEKQEISVKTIVLETRTKINGHLDKLQEKLLRELRSTHHKCKSNVMKTIQKLESTEEMFTKLREQTLHMKEFSSDIQVFLGTRQAYDLIESEIKSIKDEIDYAKDYELKVTIHSTIEKLSNEVEEFGQIKISECSTKLDFREKKINQAQIGINLTPSRNISNIRLQLIKTFQMKSTNKLNITGCVILPDNHLLMTNDTKENNLLEYKDTGEHIRDIQVSGPPYDIAMIDLDRIIVTYGDALFVEIMHTNTFTVEKKISLQNSCLGVSHADGRIYLVYGNEIQVMDISGKQLARFKAASAYVANIKTSRDRIFYPDNKNSKVHCCFLNGEKLWQFKCENTDFPKGVTVDKYHNVYVVGCISDNLIIIQHDGKDSKTLLRGIDGLNYPKAIDIDTVKQTLLICNEEGKVALYKII